MMYVCGRYCFTGMRPIQCGPNDISLGLSAGPGRLLAATQLDGNAMPADGAVETGKVTRTAHGRAGVGGSIPTVRGAGRGWLSMGNGALIGVAFDVYVAQLGCKRTACRDLTQ